jgi:hypothetical protein
MHVFMVFDESGSMGEYSSRIRSSMQALYNAKPPDCEMGFIGFSDYAMFGNKLEDVHQQRGATNIAEACFILSRKIASIDGEITVVFISDGQDSFPDKCSERLGHFAVAEVPCTLLCVGVGDGFPTALVTDQLRPLFHTCGNDALPAVIPLCSEEEIVSVFAELEAMLFYRDDILAQYDQTTCIRALTKGCFHLYNKAVNRSTASDIAASILALQGIKELAVLACSSRLYTVEGCIEKASRMIGQLQQMLDRRTCETMSRCSDAERQKILSYGHVVGRHTKTAQTYHGAQFTVSRNTLREFLMSYETNSHDEVLDEKINWCTQAEYFLEGKNLIGDVMSAPSLIHLIKVVPVVCRTLTMKLPLPQGLQMNPWLGKIEAMPTILTHMTTEDFFERFKNKKASHGESVTGIMLVTRNPTGSILTKGIGKHLSSYLLTRNADLYFPDADLATWAMVAVYILGREQQCGWMLEELETLRIMHKAVYSSEGSWTKYMDVVAGDSFREALAASSDEFPKFCACPHLKKFILACFFQPGISNLEERRDAALVEFFARLGLKDVSELFFCSFNVTAIQMLDECTFSMMPTLHESVKLFRSRLRNTCIYGMAREKMQGSCDVKMTTSFKRWNLTVTGIETIFASMARIASVEMAEMTESRLASLALTAFSVRSPIERSKLTSYVTLESMLPTITGRLVGKFIDEVRQMADGYVWIKQRDARAKSHVGMPILITKEFAAGFLETHGRDLAAELDVNEYGLSRCACMYPACGFFAQPLGKKAVCRKGNPRMTDRLREHLSVPIQGVHRAVFMNPTMEPDDVCRAVGAVDFVALGSLISKIKEPPSPAFDLFL